MSIEAMKLALEELEAIHPGNMTPMAEEAWNKAITSLRKAIAQAEQAQPYGWKVYGVNALFVGEYAEQYAKAEAKRIGGTCIAFPLYTAPQPRQPLTDDQLEMIWRKGPYEHGTLYDFKLAARDTEAAHGIGKGAA